MMNEIRDNFLCMWIMLQGENEYHPIKMMEKWNHESQSIIPNKNESNKGKEKFDDPSGILKEDTGQMK